jgi:hypothetical protein
VNEPDHFQSNRLLIVYKASAQTGNITENYFSESSLSTVVTSLCVPSGDLRGFPFENKVKLKN